MSEAKTFFKDNYSHIYYIFFDNFVTVEADLKQRGRWQYNNGIIHIFKDHRHALWQRLRSFRKPVFVVLDQVRL